MKEFLDSNFIRIPIEGIQIPRKSDIHIPVQEMFVVFILLFCSLFSPHNVI